MGRRRKARELAMQVLYQIDMVDSDARAAVKERCLTDKVDQVIADYAMELVSGVQKSQPVIDPLITRYATEWTIDRMPIVDRNILRIAIYEMFFLSGVPAAVAMNEAINIAKKFSTDDSGKFINGVLDQIASQELTDGPGQTK